MDGSSKTKQNHIFTRRLLMRGVVLIFRYILSLHVFPWHRIMAVISFSTNIDASYKKRPWVLIEVCLQLEAWVVATSSTQSIEACRQSE